MDSGLVTVGTNADMFNQLLSPGFNTPDATYTTQFLGGFGLSPQATLSATAAVLSGSNPFASQAAMAPTLLAPLGAGSAGTVMPGTAAAPATGMNAGGGYAAAPATGMVAGGGYGYAAAPPVSAESLMTHPALIAAVENFIATGGGSAIASPLTPAYGYTPVIPAAAPLVDPSTIAAAGGAAAGIGSVATPPDATTAITPDPADSITADTATTDPAATDSAATDTAATDPAVTDPAATELTPADATPAPTPPAPADEPAAGGKEYVVKSGDSLSAIAKRNGITNWKEIYELPENKAAIGDNPNLIKPGLKLTLPGEAPAEGTAKPSTPAASTKPSTPAS